MHHLFLSSNRHKDRLHLTTRMNYDEYQLVQIVLWVECMFDYRKRLWVTIKSGYVVLHNVRNMTTVWRPTWKANLAWLCSEDYLILRLSCFVLQHELHKLLNKNYSGCLICQAQKLIPEEVVILASKIYICHMTLVTDLILLSTMYVHKWINKHDTFLGFFDE